MRRDRLSDGKAPKMAAPSGAVRGPEIVDVRSFGATGNGIDDDCRAINKALNAVSGSGGAVFFPAGTYLISRPLNLPNRNLRLFGAGRKSSVIQIQLGAPIRAFRYRHRPDEWQFLSFHDLSVAGDDITSKQIAFSLDDRSSEYLRVDFKQADVLNVETVVFDASTAQITAVDCRWVTASTGKGVAYGTPKRKCGQGSFTGLSVYFGNENDTCGRFSGLANVKLVACQLYVRGGCYFGAAQIDSCEFHATEPTKVHVFGSPASIANSSFYSPVTLCLHSHQFSVVGSDFNATDLTERCIDIASTAQMGAIVANQLLNGTEERIRNAGQNIRVIGNYGPSVKVRERAPAEHNFYFGNQGFTIPDVRPDTVIEGTSAFVAQGTSEDENVYLCGDLNEKGVFGIGTCENTGDGDNAIDVEVVVDDLAGTRATEIWQLAPGQRMTLSPLAPVPPVRPPFKSLDVWVKSTAEGRPSSYSIRYSSRGSVRALDRRPKPARSATSPPRSVKTAPS